MDFAVPTAVAPVRGTFAVPPSKSIHQRALALAALCPDEAVVVRPAAGLRPPGDDVARCAAALAALGTWHDGALGRSRESLTLELGKNGTGFRFATALATLRPEGARSLVRGRPSLMQRPHAVLLRALEALGAHVKRRSSGAVRILGGGVAGGRSIYVDIARSSQYASALLLLAPRIGGLTVELPAHAASRAYVRVTERVLGMFGVPVESSDTRIVVPACVPRGTEIVVEADASAAACWRAAAALTGGEATIPGLPADSEQPDAVVGDVIRRLAVSEREPLDLRDCTDLVFLAGVLAAAAEGETTLTGVSHTRRKESDRIAVLVNGLRALGADVSVDAEDAVHIRGGGLHGARVDCAGDHRAAIAFGVLGLKVPGVVLGGAECVAKSQPTFLQDLAQAARGPSESTSEP